MRSDGVTRAPARAGSWRSSVCRPDGLQVEVLVDRMRRPIASESRLLEAPEGGGQRGSVEAVDPYRTGAQRARNAMRDVHVIGPDRGGQAVDRVIGEGHCLALVRER